MSNLTATIRARADLALPKNVDIYNESVLLANTEYSKALPNNTQKILIKIRNHTALLKLAFVLNDSGVKYITVPYGCNYSAEGINLTGSIYFQCDQPNQVVEIEVWY